MADFRVIVPVRYQSVRFPGKPLIDIHGKPMIQHVYEHCLESGADSVVIATDDRRVSDVAEGFGAKVVMTSSEHTTGTDRIAEAVEALDCDEDEIIVNVQGDEPLVPPEAIAHLAEDLAEHDNVKIATLAQPISDVEELFNPNVVKVVLNRRGYAMYFTRAAVPWERENFSGDRADIQLNGYHYRHVGMYAYRVSFLKDYVDWSDCPLEGLEQLEQLRILWNGGRIHICQARQKMPPDVNTPEDLEKVLAYMQK